MNNVTLHGKYLLLKQNVKGNGIQMYVQFYTYEEYVLLMNLRTHLFQLNYGQYIKTNEIFCLTGMYLDIGFKDCSLVQQNGMYHEMFRIFF